MDLLPRIKGMYRLLELFSEQGSGGVVDKIIISQDSVSQLVEQLYPGAYSSLTKVWPHLDMLLPCYCVVHGRISLQIDFTSLDQISLQPIGVYGSLPSLVDFMAELGAVDSPT